MKKEERIRRYGEAAYKKMRQLNRDWNRTHPEQAKTNNQEGNRKGGKYYEQHRQHQMNGVPHERELVRGKHRYLYRECKKIVAPESQLHHQWVPGTAEYTGVALVEAKPHQCGYIDVIQILEGGVTLLTEEAIRNGGGVI